MAEHHGLIVTHGDFGAELVRLAELVLGPEQELTSLSNRGLSGSALQDTVREWLANHPVTPDQGAIVFVDDYGGSCATAVRLASRNRSDVAILTGVNLAMILGFLTWRNTLSLTDLARKLVEVGRGAINRIETQADGGDPA